MRVHDKELILFKNYMDDFHANALSATALLTTVQRSKINLEVNKLRLWQKNNEVLHEFLIILPVFINIVGIILLGLIIPFFLQLSYSNCTLLALLYGYTSYSLTVYSLHEVNGHNSILSGNSYIIKVTNFILKNSCRIVFADPEYYLTQHSSHHTNTATEDDLAFTQVVLLKRFLISIIPFIVATKLCDYKIHTQDKWTMSKAISEFCSIFLLAIILYIIFIKQGLVHALIFLIIAPWFSFFLDRLRETSEHHLMPDIKGSQARSFGVTFWGILIGGGPWGQCCHLAHHLAPSLPWYQQIVLHRFYSSIMTLPQKKLFLRGGFIDYLFLWTEIIKFHIKQQ